MWIGLMHLTAQERDDGRPGDAVLLFVQEQEGERPYTISAGPDDVADVVAFLRACRSDGARMLPLECGACHAALDLPDIDHPEEVAA